MGSTPRLSYSRTSSSATSTLGTPPVETPPTAFGGSDTRELVRSLTSRKGHREITLPAECEGEKMTMILILNKAHFALTHPSAAYTPLDVAPMPSIDPNDVNEQKDRSDAVHSRNGKALGTPSSADREAVLCDKSNQGK